MVEVSKEGFTLEGYHHVRQLDDGTWIGLLPLLFTTGLCMGMDAVGWSKRYCFESLSDCIKEADKLKTFDDIPTGWIAKRPE